MCFFWGGYPELQFSGLRIVTFPISEQSHNHDSYFVCIVPKPYFIVGTYFADLETYIFLFYDIVPGCPFYVAFDALSFLRRLFGKLDNIVICHCVIVYAILVSGGIVSELASRFLEVKNIFSIDFQVYGVVFEECGVDSVAATAGKSRRDKRNDDYYSYNVFHFRKVFVPTKKKVRWR